ncbi:hypothetical protein, partial [Pedobacter paludis]
KRRRKIKNILFGSCEKIPTFALPTETKGKESRNGGCRKDRKKKIETGGTRGRRSRLPGSDTRRYIKGCREAKAEQVLKRDVNVA